MCLLRTDSCCCNHGGRCTCCHKKEHSQLETVPEAVSPRDIAAPAKSVKGGIRNRRRATHSEGILSFDENGNRKSSLKHAKASQKGEPYQLNRQNSAYSLHSASPIDSPSCNSPSSSSGFPERRKSKSEAASPLMTGSSSLTHLNGQLPPLDLSSIDYGWHGNKFDLYTSTSDFEQPMFSAGLSAASVDWSHYDGLDFAAKAAADFAAPSNYSQPQSYGGFDIGSVEQPPTLTTSTSTSGEPSEIDDLISSSFEELENANGYRTTAMGTGFDVAQISQSLLSNTDLATLDYDEFKMMKAGTQFLPTPASLAGDEPVLVSTSSTTMGNFASMVDDDPTLWMGSDYCHGLPSHDFQLPLTDSPDGSSMATFWGNQ